MHASLPESPYPVGAAQWTQLPRPGSHEQEAEALGRFAGRVAHDFNNLLAAIKGASQMLLLDLPTDHPARPDAALIDQAATRAGGLTQQLLAFTQRQLLHPRTLDLNALLTEVCAVIAGRAAPPVDIALLLHPDPLIVHVDPAQLQRALLALAENAFEAMPVGGKLTLTSRAVQVTPGRRTDGVPAGHYARITVRDNGIGIDGDVLPRVAEPFFTTKGERVGRGLGLSTASGIVAQSGGCLRVVSEAGDGTTIRICLPLLAVPSDRTEEAG